jgi:uncharacterized protein
MSDAQALQPGRVEHRGLAALRPRPVGNPDGNRTQNRDAARLKSGECRGPTPFCTHGLEYRSIEPVTTAPAVGSLRPRHRAAVLAFVCLVAVTTLVRPIAAQNRNFIWKATGAQGTVYLVGSVHMLTKDYYPLSPALDQAFKESDLLVEELDLAEMLAPESQLAMLTRGMLPSGQSLDAVVSKETFEMVSARATSLGLPIDPLKRFKPWALALMLLGMEWQKAGFEPDLGLDKHFYDRAKAEGKAVQGLETVAFQISRFDEMSMADQDRLLQQSLKELETEKAAVKTMVNAWRAGDVATIEKIVLQDVKDDPVMYRRLIVERNQNWLPRIQELFTRAKPAFVVVGAAHLIGPDGLLATLRARGFSLVQL